jgi:RNA methyltransferase, TrmH family
MQFKHISSRDNQLLRRVRQVRDGKIAELMFIEGMRLSEEALNSGVTIEAAVISDQLARKPKSAELIDRLCGTGLPPVTTSEKLLESISFTATPQGIVMLGQRPVFDAQSFAADQEGAALLVIMHGINNPVNVGAILRTAEAAGATGIVTTRHTSDPFSPKSLRGSMGSAFRLPIWSGVTYSAILRWCADRGIRTICGDVGASATLSEADWTGSSALVLGPESSGLSADEVAQADQAISIPMQGEVESLNVAVAAAVILFEAARQRSQMRPA